MKTFKEKLIAMGILNEFEKGDDYWYEKNVEYCTMEEIDGNN